MLQCKKSVAETQESKQLVKDKWVEMTSSRDGDDE